MIDPADSATLRLSVSTDTPVRRHFISAERAYSVMLTQDLFGDWIVMQAWSGRYNRKSGGMSRPVDGVEAGLIAIAAVIRKREKRGYQAAD